MYVKVPSQYQTTITRNKGRKRLLWLREVQTWGGKHKYEAHKTNHTLLGFSAEIEPHGLSMRAFRRTVCHSPLPGAHHYSN